MNFPLQWTQKVAVFKHSTSVLLGRFWKIGIFGIRKRSSTNKPNFMKIWEGGLHGLDQLMWNDPPLLTTLTKKPETQNQNCFFCRLKHLQHLLRV